MAAVTGSQYKSNADFNSSPRNFFPHRGIGRTANFEALYWPQFTRQLAINKFIRQIFMQGFVNKSLFTYIKTHLSTVNGQLIFRRPGKVTRTFPGYSLPTEISDFPRKYTGKMDGAITPTK